MDNIITTSAWRAISKYSQQCNNKKPAVFKLKSELLSAKFIAPNLDNHILTLFNKLIHQCNLTEKITHLYNGDKVNLSEDKPAYHVLQRLSILNKVNTPQAQILKQHYQQMCHIAQKIRSGQWHGYTGKAITTVVNIGIGGSDLGPKLVTYALDNFKDVNIKFKFASNMDSECITQLLNNYNPETTLFIVSSKSFSTVETLENAKKALQWLNRNEAVNQHFIAITANKTKACQFLGLNEENVLLLSDNIGGRYSIWSAIGLPLMISTGIDNFEQFIHGAHTMDNHFITQPLEDNIPMLLAMFDIWLLNFCQYQTRALIPYAEKLNLLINYLTQLYMESLGKNIDNNNNLVDYPVGTILWGGIGTNSQHAFSQFLIQGTHKIPCEFIGIKQDNEQEDIHNKILANLEAQITVLSKGKNNFQQQPIYKIMLNELSPSCLGSLLAMYEHRLYTQAVIWDVNPFDQPAVEIAKKIARDNEIRNQPL